MQARGYSLVEVLVVICVVATLLAIATPRLSDYLTRYRTDEQTRMLFLELQRARSQAIFQRRTVRVRVARDRFACYSTVSDEERGAQPVEIHPMAYPVVSNNRQGDATRGYVFDFEPTGLASTSCSICLESCAGSGAADSIVVSETRISLGKKDKGDACETDNITKR